jgi:hypothetical protein
MKVRHLAAAAATALLLSPAVFAATPAAAAPASCSSLEAQFDRDVMKTTSADANKARSLRAEGGKLCSEGKSADGIKKLNEAIKLLGTPHTS